ncbi:hypothetical protein [Caldifermentibacillus hisashii]
MRKKFTTTLDEKIIKQLKLYALDCDTDASKVIEKALKELFDKEKK